MQRDIYPLTIVKDRYTGVYSGGLYTAWNLDPDEVPIEICCGDSECMSFWMNNDILVGIGNTMQDAANDLERKLESIPKKESRQDNLCDSPHKSRNEPLFKIIEDMIGEVIGDLQIGEFLQEE